MMMLQKHIFHTSNLRGILLPYGYLNNDVLWYVYQTFQYNFDDPMGYKISNKILTIYLKTKKGNWLSMSILFLFLGQKLELHLRLSANSSHILVKFAETEIGKIYNVEATSSGRFARDE